jgi:hypothetical protein
MEFREGKGNEIRCMYVCGIDRGFSGGGGGGWEVGWGGR